MADYSLLALTYFHRVAQSLHMTKTAQELHVAQPSLSRTIGLLEKQLGAKLFERRGRGISLTPAGQVVLRHADRILREIGAMEQALHDTLEEQERTVFLSVYAASKLVPPIIADFRSTHPSINLRIIQQDIRTGGQKADLVISSGTFLPESSHSVRLMEEELLLAMPVTHPLSGRDSVDLAEFAGADFICFQNNKNMRTITDYYCSVAGFSPHVILESDSPETVREFIRAGIGVALIPPKVWGGMASASVALVPVSSPRCRRSINLSWDEGAELSPPAVLLRDHLIEGFRKL